MNLDLSDDQRMLKDSVERMLAECYSFDHRHAHAAGPDGWSRAIWSAFAELGLLTLPFAEEDGGLGLGAAETMIVGEAFGRALVVEPYLPAILAGTAIARGGAAEQRARWLPGLMDGSRVFAFADRAEVAATPHDDGWVLAGAATMVLAGETADAIVVPTDSGTFVVAAERIGRRGYRLHGGGGGADLILASVTLAEEDRLATPVALAAVVEAGIAHLAAEAAGAMAAAFDLTVEHLKTREQFGRLIGANQALRHRAAEMLVEVEQARSTALYAAFLAEETDAAERARGFAAVKAVIGSTGRFVAQQAVQLHGGIGVSEEHAISHYFRRLTAIGMLLGDTDAHVARLAALGGFTDAMSSA